MNPILTFAYFSKWVGESNHQLDIFITVEQFGKIRHVFFVTGDGMYGWSFSGTDRPNRTEIACLKMGEFQPENSVESYIKSREQMNRN